MNAVLCDVTKLWILQESISVFVSLIRLGVVIISRLCCVIKIESHIALPDRQ
jgi:hypothetical protein